MNEELREHVDEQEYVRKLNVEETSRITRWVNCNQTMTGDDEKLNQLEDGDERFHRFHKFLCQIHRAEKIVGVHENMNG